MDIKKVKKNLVIKVGICSLIVAIVIAIFIYLGQFQDKYQQQYNWLRSDISSFNRKIENLNKKTLEFSDAVKKWNEIGGDEKKLGGLRISEAKELIDTLKERYKLSDLEISFSKPKELTGGELASDVISVIESEVNLTLKAVTDEYLLNVIYALKKEFPGYIQIKSFSMSRSGEVTKEILQMLSKGENPGLVNAQVDFIWRDLKYKQEVPSKKDDG